MPTQYFRALVTKKWSRPNTGLNTLRTRNHENVAKIDPLSIIPSFVLFQLSQTTTRKRTIHGP